MKCIICGKKADSLINAYSLCSKDLETFINIFAANGHSFALIIESLRKQLKTKK